MHAHTWDHGFAYTCCKCVRARLWDGLHGSTEVYECHRSHRVELQNTQHLFDSEQHSFQLWHISSGGYIMLQQVSCTPFIIHACTACSSWSPIGRSTQPVAVGFVYFLHKQKAQLRLLVLIVVCGVLEKRKLLKLQNNLLNPVFIHMWPYINGWMCTVLSLFQLVTTILAALTMGFALCVVCGSVWPCLQEFMDDGCCEIQWKPKWKSNCSVNVCICAKIGLALRAWAWIHFIHRQVESFTKHSIKRTQKNIIM